MNYKQINIKWTGDLAFYTCSSLTKIELVSGLKLIGKRMFDMFGLDTLLAILTISSTIIAVGNLRWKIIK